MRLHNFEAAEVLQRVLPAHRLSAANLLDYLTLRNIDLREIQAALAQLGLSSLGRAEEHVITTLERVIDNLHVLAGEEYSRRTESAVSYEEGERILAANSVALLGSTRPDRAARILVTMPTEAADDYGLVVELLARAWTAPESIARTTLPINGVKWPPTFDGRPSRSGVRALC